MARVGRGADWSVPKWLVEAGDVPPRNFKKACTMIKHRKHGRPSGIQQGSGHSPVASAVRVGGKGKRSPRSSTSFKLERILALTRGELTIWALANGWRVIAGHPSLTKPGARNDPIVRLVLKATVVDLEVRKPAGKWENVAGKGYGARLGRRAATWPWLRKVPSIRLLMQQNRDAMVFGRMRGS
jgi:hypothetical protein